MRLKSISFGWHWTAYKLDRQTSQLRNLVYLVYLVQSPLSANPACCVTEDTSLKIASNGFAVVGHQNVYCILHAGFSSRLCLYCQYSLTILWSVHASIDRPAADRVDGRQRPQIRDIKSATIQRPAIHVRRRTSFNDAELMQRLDRNRVISKRRSVGLCLQLPMTTSNASPVRPTLYTVFGARGCSWNRYRTLWTFASVFQEHLNACSWKLAYSSIAFAPVFEEISCV